MDPTKTLRLQPGDVITALPIPREVTAVRGVHLGGSHSRYVWDRRHDGWRARIEGGARVSAGAMLTEYPGGLLVVEVAPEAAPEPTPDVEPEPPIRAKRTGCTGSVWTRFPEGWWLMKRAENAPYIALTWEQVQAQGPLREPRPGDFDRNPEPTPEPLPTVTDTDGGTWVEVGNTERPRADIPGFQPPTSADAEAPELARMTLADMATAAASVPTARRAVLDVDGQHFTVHVATHAALARYVGPEPRMTPDGDLVLTDQWDAEYVTTCTIAWTPEHAPGGVL